MAGPERRAHRGAGGGRRAENNNDEVSCRMVSRKSTTAVKRGLAAALVAGASCAAAQGTGGASIDSDAARWQGWLQFGAAYTYSSPGHWSQLRGRAELAGNGSFGSGVKWKLSGRAWYDAVYDGTDFYLPPVRRDQRSELSLHEAYLDFARGDWEFRVGKQNIVWGEMVGLFFADVVSAKDMREFVLPEFAQIRIPQWAVRAEWFAGDSHLEFVWLPAPATDEIGKPGAEFYPFVMPVPGLAFEIDGERRPSRSFSRGGFGVRGSTMIDGWDLSAFVYRSPDNSATFYRTVLDAPSASAVFQPRYDMLNRVGATLAKDFDGVVLKAEAVYTDGRRFASTRLDAPEGVLDLRTLDWIVGVDTTPADNWRLNAQLFQRAFLDHDPSIGLRRHEWGASLLVSHDLGNGLEAEVLAISSLVRSDWMLRPALTWKAGARSRIRVGLDVFGGEPIGMFGRFRDRDRAYAEYRYSF